MTSSRGSLRWHTLGRVTPTRPRILCVLAVLATAIGWSSVQLFESLFGRPIPVPWSAAATMAVLAAALFVWAIGILPRLKKKPGTRPLSPFIAARTAALAMAASRTGALVTGFYVGIAVALAGKFDNAVFRQRLWFALAAVAASILVVLAALWLEYICRLPGALDDHDKLDVAPEPEDTSGWVHPSTSSGRSS